MNKEKQIEVMVGLVTLAGILMLVFGVLWGKGGSLFRHEQEIHVLFNDVCGLESGDVVVVRGMEKGRVIRVTLQAHQVHVVLEIQSDVPLFDDLTVQVESQELMGGTQAALNPGKSGIPADLNHLFYGQCAGDPVALFGQAGQLLHQVDTLLVQIDPLEIQNRLFSLMDQIKSTAEQSEKLIEENRKSIEKTVASLEQSAGALQQDSTVNRLGSLIARMDTMSSKMNQLLTVAESGDGTVGKLMQDPGLYRQIKTTTASLDSLVRDVKENPKRYIHVSVF